MIRISQFGQGPEFEWVLDCLLHELAGHWLVIACGAYPCRQAATWPLQGLQEAFDKRVTLREVVHRLRCSGCGSKPQFAALRETLGTRKGGSRKGWALRLLPLLEIQREYREPFLPLEDHP